MFFFFFFLNFLLIVSTSGKKLVIQTGKSKSDQSNEWINFCWFWYSTGNIIAQMTR